MSAETGIRAEWIILADHAEVVNSKLYLMGGGWERLLVGSNFPITQRLGIALSFQVPWTETGRQHRFDVQIIGPAGEKVVDLNGHFEVGRPTSPEQSQRLQVAINAQLNFDRPGKHTILVSIGGREVGRTSFKIETANQPEAKPSTLQA